MTIETDDQYEDIGQKYNDVKSTPIVKFIEVPTFISMLSELKGSKVLDLACGSGFYSRMIKNLGAKSVTGVDLSSTMIAARGLKFEVSISVYFRSVITESVI